MSAYESAVEEWELEKVESSVYPLDTEEKGGARLGLVWKWVIGCE